MAIKQDVAKTWGPNTWNNYTEEDIEKVKSWAELCSAMVAGLEIGESGTPHIQFTMTFLKSMRLSGLKKLEPKVHWEKTIDTDRAFEYAAKDGNLIVDIRRKGKGARTDLESVRADIAAGLTMADIVEKPYNYQCLRTAELIMKHKRQRAVPIDKEIIWIWGPTGTGKTTWAQEKYPDAYIKEGNKWWNNYGGEETVIIDEFRGDLVPFPMLLFWLNKMSFPAESKGGREWITAKRFIITSCSEPAAIYGANKVANYGAYEEASKEANLTANGEDVRQLLRRLTLVMNFASREADL